ncbi:ATP-binding cassette domain-containing protein [Helicobacter baculiformis]|uniref:ATP-binding cassette domain-containing protein n=1 Tax=Helicobacter baculiformis TaxID=427351 RepID=A0ABV7ZJV6_9HELI|nr:ATP-binding cassette domain-containing protein [Helicobacter baculiformis]
MVEVARLNVHTPQTQILHSISFATDAHLAILGSSGSGKSTLCKAICGILPNSLRADYAKLYTDGRASYVFQDCISCFFPYLKIKDTFKMVLKEMTEKASPIFDRLNIPSKAWNLYPYELSRGMASRIQIALNLALEAKILLLDEVTSSLDADNTHSVIELLLQLETQRVVITHDEEVAFRLCDMVLVLESGQITYFGDKMGYFS